MLLLFEHATGAECGSRYIKYIQNSFNNLDFQIDSETILSSLF